MRSALRVAVLLTFAGLFVPRPAAAQSYNYGGWSWQAEKSYYYRKCTFQNSDMYFYAVYKPSFTRNYIFCYNPYTRRYWCACPTYHHPRFSVSGRYINLFVLILNVPGATTVENSALPGNPQSSTTSSVPLNNANGEPVATLGSMPTDLPAG